ncbi:MAG: polyphosphate kinase 2 family protein [Actinomycetota bacterium]|nr:polyphosphate kinase 2 family protein [Actinomycetota bacterium]
MKLHAKVIDELVVRPGEPAGLHRRDTRAPSSRPWEDGASGAARELAESDLEEFRSELSSAQELLYASDRYALLVVVQALDAGGKDGTIKHVMSGVNPQGCSVASFKAPSAEELGHDFLWRCSKALPERGRIGIFNRSYYEDVLVTRVHPELVERLRLPEEAGSGEELWARRYDDINAFERHLHRNATRIVKIFLHVSKAEQRRRLLERLDDPSKHWKFSAADLVERAYFDDYERAYEAMLGATSTAWAPWYVVPADHKHLMRALVGALLVHTVRELDLRLPEPGAAELAAIDAARHALRSE